MVEYHVSTILNEYCMFQPIGGKRQPFIMTVMCRLRWSLSNPLDYQKTARPPDLRL